MLCTRPFTDKQPCDSFLVISKHSDAIGVQAGIKALQVAMSKHPSMVKCLGPNNLSSGSATTGFGSEDGALRTFALSKQPHAGAARAISKAEALISRK